MRGGEAGSFVMRQSGHVGRRGALAALLLAAGLLAAGPGSEPAAAAGECLLPGIPPPARPR